MVRHRLHPRADARHRGRQHDQPGPEVERGERHQHQTHVVVHRQPAHERVVRRDLHSGDHLFQIHEDVPVAQLHALRIAGAPGGVLDEREVVRVDERDVRRCWPSVALSELHDGSRRPFAQLGELRRSVRKHDRARSAEPGEIGDPSGPRIGEDRNGDPAGELDAEERAEEVDPVRNGDDDAVAAVDAMMTEKVGAAQARGGQIARSDGVAVPLQRRAVRIVARANQQHLGQRCHARHGRHPRERTSATRSPTVETSSRSSSSNSTE